MSPLLYLLPFTATLLVGLMLVHTQHWHGHVSLDSHFGVQKLHVDPTPRIGGVAIAAGLLLTFIFAPRAIRQIIGPMVLAGIPAFTAGLLEDITKNVAVRVRLLATMASGVLAWAITGTAMQDTGLWGLDHLLALVPVAVLFTAFVVSGVANATNIIDGFNGLAGGVVAIMLAAMGLIALRVGDPELATVAFLLACIALGFVAVNWPLGKIFMGDGGAYLLGFLVAWVAILLPMRHDGIHGWTTLLACAYPVLEVLFSIRRKIKREGHHPGQPDKCHLHHFLYRRVIRKRFPSLSRTLQNGLTGSLVWALAALPALWAVFFYQNTAALALGFFLAAFGYRTLFARLTQFVWCFQAATMRRPSAIAHRAG
jgi:UDP-N-acetylmuramyl pentapeptide phosphotransferase/UDP-N-acetylglucosamine-1-phosphate transferase